MQTSGHEYSGHWRSSSSGHPNPDETSKDNDDEGDQNQEGHDEPTDARAPSLVVIVATIVVAIALQVGRYAPIIATIEIGSTIGVLSFVCQHKWLDQVNSKRYSFVFTSVRGHCQLKASIEIVIARCWIVSNHYGSLTCGRNGCDYLFVVMRTIILIRVVTLEVFPPTRLRTGATFERNRIILVQRRMANREYESTALGAEYVDAAPVVGGYVETLQNVRADHQEGTVARFTELVLPDSIVLRNLATVVGHQVYGGIV